MSYVEFGLLIRYVLRADLETSMTQCCKDFWPQLLITLILSSWLQDHDQLWPSFLMEPASLLGASLKHWVFCLSHFSSVSPDNLYHEAGSARDTPGQMQSVNLALNIH